MTQPLSNIHPKIDHRFAVHRQRFTVGYPEGSRKTLVDLWEPGIVLRWSQQCLADMDAFKNISMIRPTEELSVVPDLPPGWRRTYRRVRNYPILHLRYRGREGALRLEVAGGPDADIIKLTLTAASDAPTELTVNIRANHADCATGKPELRRNDNRVFCFADGDFEWCRSWFDHRPLLRLTLKSTGQPAWVIIPHAATLTDTSCWDGRRWPQEWHTCVDVWRKLLKPAVRFVVPDAKIVSAYQACLADQFILREPLAGGGMGVLCGTDLYRAVNAFEIDVHVHALLRAGYPEQAWAAAEVLLPLQKDSGRWDDFSPWMAGFWFVNGDIPMLFRELYRFTGDRRRMVEVYPKLLKLARWAEAERAKSKFLPLEDPRYGLMPPGVGDGGLCRDLNMAQGKGLHHVFFMHNAGNVAGLRVTAELAGEFGSPEEVIELRTAYEDARQCFVNSIERCAVPFAGGRYVPTSTAGADGGGSLWGCAAFAYPGHLVAYDHPLVTGTLAWFETNQSATGVPLNTGWQSHGVWPSGILENPAPVYLRRGEVDKLTALIYAALNHGSPVWTWPEERQPGAGTSLTSGDMQEAWFPFNFCRLFRDLFLYEEDEVLHLAAGIPRFWHGSAAVGVIGAPSYFGPVSYLIKCNWEAAMAEVTGEIGGERKGRAVVLHLNLPCSWRVAEILDTNTASEVRVKSDRLLFDANGPFVIRLRLSAPGRDRRST